MAKSPREWRALVTGASGFLGSHLVRALAALGAEVIALVPNRHDIVSLSARGISDKADVWFGSVLDPELLRSIFAKHDVNVCFHLAAVSQVRRASSSPIETFRTNIEGTWNLLEVCRRRPGFQAFVGASTDKAYGDHGTTPYEESMPLLGLHTYDVSKTCADQLMRSAAEQFDLPVVVTRCSNLYGPGDLNWDRLLPNTIRRLHRGERPVIHEGAENFTRSFISIWDAVNAYLFLAARATDLAGQAFNVCDETSGSRKVVDVMREITERCGKPFEPDVRPRERNFLEIPHQSMSGAKMRKLGWEAKVPMSEALDASVRWYKTFLETGAPPPLDFARSIREGTA